MSLGRLDPRSAGILLLVALALFAGWLLYPRSADQAGASEQTNLTFWVISGFFDQLRPLVDEFEKDHPEYKVTMGTAAVRDAVGDPTRFLLGVAGGEPPDVIFFDRFAIVEWASRGAFAPLDDFVAADRARPDGVHRENFYSVAWEEPNWQGKQYAIPNTADTRAMYYAHDPLIRAGFRYEPDDPRVLAGKARAGDPRPPLTWEEMVDKRIHATGRAQGDGRVELTGFVRRPAVNDDLPADARIDLAAAGIRAGDVVALVAGAEVFRARIARVLGPSEFQVDLVREQRPGLNSLPAPFAGNVEVKVFDQDGYIPRLTRFDPQTGRMTDAGFIPLFGNSWLYMYGWLNGGEFMSEDGRRVTLDDPRIAEALQWLTDVYDSMGGFEPVNVFGASGPQPGGGSGELDHFIGGHVAMRIDTAEFITTITGLRPDLRYGVSPPPIPLRRLEAGFSSFGWMGGFAYAIPATAQHKEEGWELLRWLVSLEANQMRLEWLASLARAQGQPYFPALQADQRLMQWIRERYIQNNPGISPNVVSAFDTFIEMLPTSRYRPVTPVGQKLWNEHVRASNAALLHTKDPYSALSYGTLQTQLALDTILNPPEGRQVNWRVLVVIYGLCVALVFAAVALWQERRRRLFGLRGRRDWIDGYIAASPWLVGFIVFGAAPIIFSFIIGFCEYDGLNPARFTGLNNYVKLLGTHYDAVLERRVQNDPIFWNSLWNTLFMVIQVPIGIVLGLAIALLLDTNVRGLHFYRTAFYLPAIVPAVAAYLLWLWVLNPRLGLVNMTLMKLGVENLPNWLQDAQMAKPSIMLVNLWAVGASMIIWLAGLKDIPESYYEAAAIDGAGRVQTFFTVTLPLLSPYIFFNMVMGFITIFQIFEIAYIMTDGGPADATLFFAYKLFNEAFRFLSFGTASAMAWLLFVVVLAVTLVQLWLAKKWVHYGA